MGRKHTGVSRKSSDKARPQRNFMNCERFAQKTKEGALFGAPSGSDLQAVWDDLWL